MVKLYEITHESLKLWKEQDALTEEELAIRRQEISELLEKKSAALVAFSKQKEADIQALKNEEQRLNEMRKHCERQLESYRSYVKDNMETMGIKTIETPLGKLTIAKGGKKVNITGKEDIPIEFCRVETKIEPDKVKIMQHFKDTGEVIDGVDIIEAATSLRIG